MLRYPLGVKALRIENRRFERKKVIMTGFNPLEFVTCAKYEAELKNVWSPT